MQSSSSAMPSLLLCLDVCLLVTLIDVSLGQQYRTAPSLRTLLRTDTTTATLAPSEVSRMRSEVSALTHEVKELRNQLKQVKRQSYAMYLVLKESTRSCDQCRTEQGKLNETYASIGNWRRPTGNKCSNYLQLKAQYKIKTQTSCTMQLY